MTDLTQPIDDHSDQPAAAAKPSQLEKYFRAMVKAEASDLHLKAGSSVYFRSKTLLRPAKSEPLSAIDMRNMAVELLTPKQQAFLAEHGSIELGGEMRLEVGHLICNKSITRAMRFIECITSK